MPSARGTTGTIVAIPVYLILSRLSWPLYLITVIAFTFLAIYVSHEAEKLFKQKDSSHIVIDEVTGFLWTMFLIDPSFWNVALGFIFFRIFDIVKAFPSGYFQRSLSGGYAVVMDDVVAGVYSNIVLQITIQIIHYITVSLL